MTPYRNTAQTPPDQVRIEPAVSRSLSAETGFKVRSKAKLLLRGHGKVDGSGIYDRDPLPPFVCPPVRPPARRPPPTNKKKTEMRGQEKKRSE